MRSAEQGKRLGKVVTQAFGVIGDKMGLGYLKKCKEVYATAQQNAEQHGADGIGGVVAGVKAMAAFVQKDQPSLFEELRAMFRAGREDLLNTLNGLSLTREAGSPGNPTAQIVTGNLMGLDLHRQNDVIRLMPANEQQQQQTRGNETDGRDGRD